MKKYFLLVVFIMITNMAFSVTLTVIVMPFKISDNAVTEDEATQIVDSITKSLLDCGVSIVDRSSLEDILEELQFQGSDWSNPKKTAELGKVLNAHMIIKGRISKHNGTVYRYIGNCVAGSYYGGYNFSISAINIQTAKIMGSESFYCETISGLSYNNIRKFYKKVSLESFACPDSIGIIRRDTKGFSFLDCVYLGKASFATAQKMAKEYKNGGLDNWHLICLDEFNELRKLHIFDESGRAWSTNKGKPCVVRWGENIWGVELSSIESDKDINEEFDVYVVR